MGNINLLQFYLLLLGGLVGTTGSILLLFKYVKPDPAPISEERLNEVVGLR